jgi:ribosomal protein S27AE
MENHLRQLIHNTRIVSSFTGLALKTECPHCGESDAVVEKESRQPNENKTIVFPTKELDHQIKKEFLCLKCGYIRFEVYTVTEVGEDPTVIMARTTY